MEIKDKLTSELLKVLSKDSAVDAILSNKEGLSNLDLNQEALVIASTFYRGKRNMVVVKSNLFQAQNLYHRVNELVDNVILFAVEESLQIQAIASSPELEATRIENLNKLISNDKPILIITHLAGLIRYLPNPNRFKERLLKIKIDQTISPFMIRRMLRENGYRLVDRVEQPLSYAYRGEVIDIFSIQYNHPIRIEFFDDLIDSIRFFDIETQMTINNIDEIEIIPATDLLFSEDEIKEIETNVNKKLIEDLKRIDEDKKDTLKETINFDLEYLKQRINENYLYRYYAFMEDNYGLLDYVKNPLIIISTKEQVESHRKELLEENVVYIQGLFEEAKALLKFDVYNDYHYVLNNKDIYEINEYINPNNTVRTKILSNNYPSLSLMGHCKEINSEKDNEIVIIALSGGQVKPMMDALIASDIKYEVIKDTLPSKNGVYFWIKSLPEGFSFDLNNYLVLTEKELFNIKIKFGRYTDKFRHAKVLNDYDDLAVGDYVVHSQYGIGKYLGIVTKEFNNLHHDYLNIAYRGDDVLLVPLDQFKLVRKFIGSEGVIPKLSKLGTNEWTKTKEKLQRNVEDIAEKLLRLYTEREKDIGFCFSKDSSVQLEFENSFEYELTEDQAKCVADIKADMESKKPMDRLICGDVGFGKTEVAIRAAFKAVMDNKQVAMLCPTTILSRQHTLTFVERFNGYPFEIALLNRFTEPSKQKAILRKIKEGKVDIVIGTHRILSKDVQFKDLGLLIIDEEQRFGVEAKERIKELKIGVDCLSLSATPIPRTLQMSLIGVRQLSRLNTPPQNRMPVQTYVIERNKNIIKEVIERELSRNGQVFYLYNNVARIYEQASNIRKLVPESKVAVAHGKMDRNQIEDVMMKFEDGEYNVLLCTTIVENGIDIPNANTMIIDNADHFGLAQLYQIKGRVGRSDKIAYAYLMIDDNRQLSEVASKRLEAIKDFAQLGSGYKIAMRDLSIRGAGDLLGAKQAGFINTVGMDLYVDMLNEAISKKKGLDLALQPQIINKSKIGVDGYIPVKFEEKDYEKIHLYQRIEDAKTENGLKKLEDEVNDRYGKIPDAVLMLFEKRRMDILASNEKVHEIRERSNDVEIVFEKSWCDEVDGIKLFEIVSKISLDLNMRYTKGQIILSLPKKNKWLELANTTLEKVNKL